jgi:restriction system protein
VLAENPAAITLAYLNHFESYLRFREARPSDKGTAESPEPQAAVQTPDAVLEKAHKALNDELAAQLLDEIADHTPQFFEKVVLDLMRAIGYGGWKDTVGRPQQKATRLHKFVGALHGRRARKGVFVTTSTFTSDAHEHAEQIDTKVVLVDGRSLARLMIMHDVGCSPACTFVVKKLDSDYFVEE